MSGKLIKFLTRRYTLLEHYLIGESVMKENTSIPEVYYEAFIDISRNGLIDICIYESDLKKNQERVLRAAKRNPNYVTKMLKEGIEAVEDLAKLPKNLPKKIAKMDNEDIIKELLNLRKKFFNFSGYLDFTHHLGACGAKMSEREIKSMGRFHDYRKDAFMDYFAFLAKVAKAIAKKCKVKSGDASFLTLDEIIDLLRGKLSPEKADKLQAKRKKHYILFFIPSKERIVSDNFEKEFAKIKNKFIEEKEAREIKGTAINKGIVKGKVKVINQNTPLSKIPGGKIIVTQMTLPAMTPVLKKAGAIITDEGGLLCHTANIAREFGIIAIIGTKVATQALKDGDVVEVDADNGVVRIVK
jgi:phosphoenolpyruvate synthase/pyruvate phosphate dikinase